MQRNLLCLVVAPRYLTRRVLQLWNLRCCLGSVLDGFFPLLSGLVPILQMFYRTAPALTVSFSAAVKLEAIHTTMCCTIGVAGRVWGASVGPSHWGYPHSELHFCGYLAKMKMTRGAILFSFQVLFWEAVETDPSVFVQRWSSRITMHTSSWTSSVTS